MWDLVPWPGINPVPPVVEAWNLSHWTAREVPDKFDLVSYKLQLRALSNTKTNC